MVSAMLSVTPTFAFKFEKIFSLPYQKSIARTTFNKLKAEWETLTGQPAQVLQNLTESKPSKKYFETNRKFNRLVPVSYHRTEAPRISAYGSTFHGMKKVLLLQILKELSLNRNAVFIDIDMGAAHTRIARYLLHKEGSNLDYSLKDPQFWNVQISKARPYYEESGVNISDKIIKKLLKVGLYTSLNGGNPCSVERLVANLSLNVEDYINSNGLVSIEDLKTSGLYRATENCFNNFTLVKEVKDINTKCSMKFDHLKQAYKTFTVDRVSPYIIDKPHKGISRVLQGFEVVLLTVLVKEIMLKGGIPVSLDHDGVLVMFSKTKFSEYGSDFHAICHNISQGLFKSWSEYLLEEGIPIEPKRVIIDGNVQEI